MNFGSSNLFACHFKKLFLPLFLYLIAHLLCIKCGIIQVIHHECQQIRCQGNSRLWKTDRLTNNRLPVKQRINQTAVGDAGSFCACSYIFSSSPVKIECAPFTGDRYSFSFSVLVTDRIVSMQRQCTMGLREKNVPWPNEYRFLNDLTDRNTLLPTEISLWPVHHPDFSPHCHFDHSSVKLWQTFTNSPLSRRSDKAVSGGQICEPQVAAQPQYAMLPTFLVSDGCHLQKKMTINEIRKPLATQRPRQSSD